MVAFSRALLRFGGFLGRLCDHRDVYGCGDYLTLWPLIKGHGHLGVAEAGFFRDPHGAVELIASAALLEDVFPRQGLPARLLGGKADLHSGANILGNKIVAHGRERAPP